MKKLIRKILREHKDPRINQPVEVGNIIELLYMDDPYNPISPLTKGVVMGFETVPGGEDKILVTWIIDPENDQMFNMPMIPEVDVWRKVDVEPPATQNVTGRDSRDSIGYPLRDVEARYQNWKRIKDKEDLSEQEEKGNRVIGGVKGFDGKQKTYHSWDPQIFFRIIKEIIDSVVPNNSLLDEMDHDSTWDRYEVFKPTLNLFGVTQDDFGWDAGSLINKLFWAIKDNYDGIKDGTITTFNQLDLRPLQTFKADLHENSVEHVTHYWSPILDAYDGDDASSTIMDDDEGLYNHYEWEGQPGYERETGDYDSDGFEIADIYVVDQSEKPTWINESESPEENDIIEELKELVSLKKESISTDEIKEIITKYTNLPINETFVSHSYEPNIGDNVKNNNPGCVHYGSEGVIEDIDDLPDEVGKTITYRVTNDGENYENGDTLTKTMDQLIPLQESVL